MAQNLAPGQIVRLQIFTQVAEQIAINTHHYKVLAVSGVAPTLEQLVSEWGVAMSSMYGDCVSASANFVGYRGQIVFPLPMFVAVDVPQIPPAPGASGLALAPRQVAGLISWRTILAGPGGRGRTYVPFASTGDVSAAGHPTPEYVTALRALAQALVDFNAIGTAPNTATLKLAIKSHNSSTATDVSTFVPNQKFATMRKRGDYGAPNTSPFATA